MIIPQQLGDLFSYVILGTTGDTIDFGNIGLALGDQISTSAGVYALELCHISYLMWVDSEFD